MKFKILILAIIVMCVVAPVMASDAIWWTNSKGQNITTAEAGDTVYFQFETVASSGGHSDPPPPHDYWGIVMYKQDSQSGTFVYDTVRYPGYSARMTDDVNGTYYNFSAHTAGYSTLLLEFQHSAPATNAIGFSTVPAPFSSYFWTEPNGTPGMGVAAGYVGGGNQDCAASPEEPFFQDYHDWAGYSEFVTPDVTDATAYKVALIGYSFPYRWDNVLCDNWTSYYTEYGNATLTVTQHWDIFTGFGDLMDEWGGDGLRFVVGAIIIIVMAMLPFFLLHRLNIYITLIMIICGVGISYLTGLFDLPVVFALGLGSLAIYFLTNRAVAGDR